MATDYEKLYKDALGRAEAIASKGPASAKFMSEIFPEFDKFNDERIRKALHEFIHDTLGDELNGYDISKAEALAYLEKQKEKKPAEWSEEDKEMLKDIIAGIEATKQRLFTNDSQGRAQMQARIDWLKSLRPRPQKLENWTEEDAGQYVDINIW